ETHRYFDCRKKVLTVPNFVDLHRFAPSRRPGLRERFCPEGHRLLIHISNFRRVKRIDRVVDWFHRIAQGVPASLLMVGDGPELPRAEQTVRELGLSGRVHFIGRQDPVESLLGISDLLLLPSETESFGLAALEALACGVPVMSSDAGGLPELVEDGSCGILVSEHSQEQGIARAIQLLSDQPQWERYQKAAITRASAYNLDRILPLYEGLYRELLEEKPRD
ncbi:MAG: glycosyltransferase, partial [Bacteroidota bacterium]